MIWVPYFETIISNTCVVRYAYICADVAIIEDYCYARCPPASPARPHYRCSQPFSMGDIPGVVVASKDKPTVGNHLQGAKWLRIMDDTHGQLDATSLVYHTLATLHSAAAYKFCT